MAKEGNMGVKGHFLGPTERVSDELHTFIAAPGTLNSAPTQYQGDGSNL